MPSPHLTPCSPLLMPDVFVLPLVIAGVVFHTHTHTHTLAQDTKSNRRGRCILKEHIHTHLVYLLFFLL